MKTKIISTISMALLLAAFSTITAIAQHEGHSTKAVKSQSDKQGKKEMSHDHMMMDMAKEPHHILAMAYHQNLATFTKALRDQALGASPLNAEFARAAVAEIRRNFDKMEEHHQEHMKTMSEDMRSKMATMMKEMGLHRSMLKDAVAALEADVQAEKLDSKQVAADSVKALMHLDAMSKMHDDMKDMKKMKM